MPAISLYLTTEKYAEILDQLRKHPKETTNSIIRKILDQTNIKEFLNKTEE